MVRLCDEGPCPSSSAAEANLNVPKYVAPTLGWEGGLVATVYRFGEFELRADERQVLARDAPLVLGGRAFDLLTTLVERRDRVVSKEELMALVWPGVVVEENNLTVQISTLRRHLGAKALATVAGRGYRFALPVSDASDGRADTINADHVATARVKAMSIGDSRSSIAVLPFEARSEDVTIGYLVDGLVEDVIAQLARVPGFLVISRSSSFEFRRRTEDVQEVARHLGVRYVVEGSVRQVGSRLRVSTQLVEAETARVMWSGQFDSDRDAAVDLQGAIARGIITELEPELTRAQITLIRRYHPDNVDAWGHYHRGVGAIALKGWNERALTEALDEFERALAMDSSFALAAAHGALIRALGLSTGLIANSESTAAAARRGAERALALEEADSQVLGYVGCALCDLGHLERGVEILQQALLIDPSNAQAHVALGASLGMDGQWDAGISLMRHGMRISPRDRRLGFWGWALALFLLRANRPEEAHAEACASAGRDVKLHLPRIVEAASLRSLGRADEAGAALTAARRLRSSLTMAEIEHSHGRRVAELLTPLWRETALQSP